jgi:Flp pilus assembly protein TadG
VEHTVTPRRSRSEDGFSTVEVVIATPVIALVLLVLAALGLTALHKGSVDTAADAAARAGSLQRDYPAAIAAARQVLNADLDGTCQNGPDPTWPPASDFTPGGQFVLTVTCRSPLLGLPGLPPATTLHGVGVAPIDPNRGLG